MFEVEASIREREAACAEAQAASFQTTQNLIYTVFGSIINKIQQSQNEDVLIEDDKKDLSLEEIEAVAAIVEKQRAAEKEKQAERREIRKKVSKKTIS